MKKLFLAVLIALSGKAFAQNVYDPYNTFPNITMQPQLSAPMAQKGAVYFNQNNGTLNVSQDGVTFVSLSTSSSGGGGGSGTVTSVSGTSPVQVANPTTTPAISLSGGLPNAVTVSTQNITPGVNGTNQLVQTNGSGQLPAISGVLLTNLSTATFNGGTLTSSLTVTNGSGVGVTYGVSVGTLTAISSITASAFFGDASHMSGIVTTVVSSPTQFNGQGTAASPLSLVPSTGVVYDSVLQAVEISSTNQPGIISTHTATYDARPCIAFPPPNLKSGTTWLNSACIPSWYDGTSTFTALASTFTSAAGAAGANNNNTSSSFTVTGAVTPVYLATNLNKTAVLLSSSSGVGVGILITSSTPVAFLTNGTTGYLDFNFPTQFYDSPGVSSLTAGGAAMTVFSTITVPGGTFTRPGQCLHLDCKANAVTGNTDIIALIYNVGGSSVALTAYQGTGTSSAPFVSNADVCFHAHNSFTVSGWSGTNASLYIGVQSGVGASVGQPTGNIANTTPTFAMDETVTQNFVCSGGDNFSGVVGKMQFTHMKARFEGD